MNSSMAGTGMLLLLISALSSQAIDLDSLTINGYSSFEYEYQIENDGDGNGDPHGSFDADLIDLVFNMQLYDRVRVAMDVTWEHGSASEDDRGNVALEYGFVEYTLTDLLRVKAGKMFIPFGYFNELHTAKPTFLSVKEAASVNKAERIVDGAFRLFPRWGVGIALQGNGAVLDRSFDYDLFIHNGEQENTNPYEEDDNRTKALAARVRIELTDGLTIGNSVYWDDEIVEVEEPEPFEGATAEDMAPVETRISLVSDSVLLLFRKNKFRLLAEAGVGYRRLDSGDSVTQVSGYLQPSYHFDNGLTPYMRYEYVDPDVGEDNDAGMLLVAGVNCELRPGVHVKLENNYYKGDSGSSLGEFPGNDYNEIKMAVAVGF